VTGDPSTDRIAILTLPATNRVYGRDAARLVVAELALVAPSLHADIGTPGIEVIGGVEYVVCDVPEVDEHDRFILSNLSGTYALFAMGGGSLRPLPVARLEYFQSDLISIQRYAGKTNEQFTHLLVNVAVAASSAAQERAGGGLPVRLFDPLAGRGTTLNRGLMYGFDVAGVDLDGPDFEAYRNFLTTYLKDNRISHKLQEAKVRKGERAGSRRFTLRVGYSQIVDVVKDDTAYAAEHFGARSFDVLAADLPYGVQHGSTAGGELARSPQELLASALPGWRRLLRSGAGVALSWNTRTLPRDALESQLQQAGFSVVDASALDHKVDRAVTRGVVVATT
jgi:hypothetical protein